MSVCSNILPNILRVSGLGFRALSLPGTWGLGSFSRRGAKSGCRATLSTGHLYGFGSWDFGFCGIQKP